MPFCTNCGSKVGDAASFCANCGAPQPNARAGSGSGRNPGGDDILSSISDRTATVLCYVPVFGVIPAIIVLASQRFRLNPRVRFDAFQALYLFVAWLIVSSAIPTLLYAGHEPGLQHLALILFKGALFVCWIYLLIKAAQEQQVRIPIIGDLAARSTTEQL